MAALISIKPCRRHLLASAAAGALAHFGVFASPQKTALEVWKDPSCGCCKDWVGHMEMNGFAVKVHDTGNDGVRARLKIDRKYGSCHTAVAGGYVFEGHVPAWDIIRLLKEKPKARGLAAPGMPVGSPGMDGDVYGGRKDTYDVLLLAHDGTATVYRRYEGIKEGNRT